ncbi:MAG: enoyl-CoA hydratase/isomerase family protein [Deltaproteobacteria bacterium]|nr:enoyl-CoA hydratase/isomerase family protein [Deltaproteobacteria bacterium]
MISYGVDSEGIVTLEWDLPGRPQNVLNDESMAAFAEAVRRALGDPEVKGLLIASGKKDFIAGADLDVLQKGSDPEKFLAHVLEWHRLTREMELGGKPVAAALNGTALGGGLELALACHYRVAAENPKAIFGLPEVSLGLLPGGGGTQRLPRLVGLQKAVPLLLEGKKLRVAEARDLGVVHAVAPAGQERESARAWLLGEGQQKAKQPWDVKGYAIPGGASNTPENLQYFCVANAMLRSKTFGNYPAPRHILSCVFEGLTTDLDTGLKIEARYFANLVNGPVSKNMIRTLFFGMQEANKLEGRPEGVPEQKYSKVGMLGAGMMGAGIAHATTRAGIEVVLLDVTQEAAEKGKAYSRTVLEKDLAKGRTDAAKMESQLARLLPTCRYEDLAGCDLVIEAVFEDRGVKAEVTRKSEAVIAPDAVFASNTSTLPITGLAEASSRPANFIGMHFFSPAEVMPLVEIIVGKQTSPETLARAMDFVKAIGKTPIVVNDSRGFYTSRVFGTYVQEGMALLAEGVAPALIENAGRIAGMPVGPLALMDEVAIDLVWKVEKQTRADLGVTHVPHPGMEVARQLSETLGRHGRKAGRGFYEYPAGGQKHLWPGLAEHYPARADQPALEDVIDRLVLIQSVEAARCLQEKVLRRAADADVGAILGWGYPAFRGGPLAWIDTYGVEEFAARCEDLAKAHPRFALPKLLKELVAEGKGIYSA